MRTAGDGSASMDASTLVFLKAVLAADLVTAGRTAGPSAESEDFTDFLVNCAAKT